METLHDTDVGGERESFVSRVETAISSHPLPAVGAAFALGAIVALASGRADKGERSVGGMIVAGLGAVALRIAKSYAFSRLGAAAKTWLMNELGADQPASPAEHAASREPATESFLEH